jgi:hypothetical protein
MRKVFLGVFILVGFCIAAGWGLASLNKNRAEKYRETQTQLRIEEATREAEERRRGAEVRCAQEVREREQRIAVDRLSMQESIQRFDRPFASHGYDKAGPLRKNYRRRF